MNNLNIDFAMRNTLYRFNEIIQEIRVIWNNMPSLLRVLLVAIMLCASFQIIFSLVKAILLNRHSWKQKPDTKLMYSYAAGSGQYQRKAIKKDAFKLLFSKKHLSCTFISFANRLGNSQSNSKSVLFIRSLFYLPFAVIGAIEFVFRVIFGAIPFLILNCIYCLFLCILWLLNLLLMPVAYGLDKASWALQHCPECYSTFRLPDFDCPCCGEKHTKLYPGRCGLLWAKCQCNHFIPCSTMSKRKDLKSHCPKCNHELASANMNGFTIQIVGGNTAGKTAFIAAFHHLYTRDQSQSETQDITVMPAEEFEALEEFYQSGRTGKSPSDKVRAYYMLRHKKRSADDGIVIYDVPDEIIFSEQYEKNPVNFAYCDAIILLIDPLSNSSIREECTALEGANSVIGYSDDSIEDMIIHFINKYSEVSGRKARRMSKTPVAVVITKSDLSPIESRINQSVIRSELEENHNLYRNYEEARDMVCRRFLTKNGFANALNNVDSAFSKVSCFYISAMGHRENGHPFEPINVEDPIYWLLRLHHGKSTRN